MNINEVIKTLIQQCKIESISTKDLVKELSELFDEVKQLEKRNNYLTEELKKEKLSYSEIENKLNKYKREYITPIEELKKLKDELFKEKFKFDIEKEYQRREIVIYQEILKTVTCSITHSENYSSGSGNNYYNKHQNVDKPSMPNSGFTTKFGDEK